MCTQIFPLVCMSSMKWISPTKHNLCPYLCKEGSFLWYWWWGVWGGVTARRHGTVVSFNYWTVQESFIDGFYTVTGRGICYQAKGTVSSILPGEDISYWAEFFFFFLNQQISYGITKYHTWNQAFLLFGVVRCLLFTPKVVKLYPHHLLSTTWEKQ